MKKRVLSFLLTVALLMGVLPFGITEVYATTNNFTISDECLDMLKEFEGFSAKPYWDYGQWTVGYGTRAPSEHLERYQTEGITREEAEQLLRDFLSEYGELINEFADKFGLTLTQGKFDALLSLSFNCGPNWLNETSTFRSAVIEGRTGNDFLFAMGQWSTAGGEVQRGLVRRRLIEINMYLNGVYSMDVPENYCYVLYDANGGERDVKVQCYDSKLTATPISVPTYEGHTFAGWYTAAEGGQKVELLDASVSSFKLYAHWTQGESEAPDTEEITGTVVDYQREVVNQTISVLEQPVSGSNVQSVVKQGDVVQIVAEYTDANGTVWGKIKNSGWINLNGTKAYSWEDAESNGVKVTVTANNVNIRSGAGTSYSRVGSVNRGEELIIVSTATGSGYTWGQFSGGWIALQYTNYDEVVNTEPEEPSQPEEDEDETQQPGDTAGIKGTVTSDDGLRVRSGAGTTYAIVGYLRFNEQVKVLEQKSVNGTPWGRISQGWICLSYVKLDQTGSEDTEEEEPATVRNGVITGSDLRVRSGPSTAYSVLGYLQKGDRVQISETKTTGTTLWGKTERGWISMDYVQILEDTDTPEEPEAKPPVEDTPDEEQPTVLKGTITGDYLRIRSGAGTGYEIVGYLHTGDRVEITEQKTVGSTTWGKITQGWISMDYVQLDDSGASEALTATVNPGNLLRVRNGAGSDYSVVGYVNAGETVVILEQKTVNGTTWGRIASGWINLAYVTMSDGSSNTPDEDTTRTGTITATVLNVRSAAGTGNTIVAVLYQGDTVTILETTVVSGTTWGRIEQGWISMDYVA